MRARVANVRHAGITDIGASAIPSAIALRHFRNCADGKDAGGQEVYFDFLRPHASAKEAKVGVNAYVLTGFRKDRRETVFQFRADQFGMSAFGTKRT